MIGFFDSGLGGLAVMREFAKKYPKMDRVFYADKAHCPYGERSPEEILLLTEDGIGFLKNKGAKVIIIACNTATVHALEALRKRAGVPLFGVTDAGVRFACAKKEWSRIGVIATTATVASGAYRDRIRAVRPDMEVFEIAAPTLVPIAEEWLEDSNKAMREVRAACARLPKELDSVILGCTHYPFLRSHFEAVLGKTAIVDPGRELVTDFEMWLNSEGSENSELRAEIRTSLVEWRGMEERWES